MKKLFLYSYITANLMGCGCYETRTFLNNKVKPQLFLGKVQNKFVDSSDRMTPKISFIEGSTINMDAYEMYDDLQPGDSVIKEAGSLKYILRRSGESDKIYYPKCDGKNIK